jgi:hypothetical protein
MKRSADDEKSACIERFVDAKGKGRFSCALQGVPLKPENSAALEAEMKTALPAALKARNGSALDALTARSDAQFLTVLQGDCTKSCVERGPNALLALTQGPTLVNSYKRCMVQADSTREARKLQAYETDLYCEYLGKANDRCRSANKCDLVEGGSDLECTYVSPGTSCPL